MVGSHGLRIGWEATSAVGQVEASTYDDGLSPVYIPSAEIMCKRWKEKDQCIDEALISWVQDCIKDRPVDEIKSIQRAEKGPCRVDRRKCELGFNGHQTKKIEACRDDCRDEDPVESTAGCSRSQSSNRLAIFLMGCS